MPFVVVMVLVVLMGQMVLTGAWGTLPEVLEVLEVEPKVLYVQGMCCLSESQTGLFLLPPYATVSSMKKCINEIFLLVTIELSIWNSIKMCVLFYLGPHWMGLRGYTWLCLDPAPH